MAEKKTENPIASIQVYIDPSGEDPGRLLVADSSGRVAEYRTIIEVLKAIHDLLIEVPPFDLGTSDDAQFERDLQYILDKNAELYRRLAQ